MSKKFHPGWAVKFTNNTWLCYAHGCHQTDNASFAFVYDTEKQANDEIKTIIEDDELHPIGEWSVVPAWEPTCLRLKNHNDLLQKANAITPKELTEALDKMDELKDIFKSLFKSLPKK